MKTNWKTISHYALDAAGSLLVWYGVYRFSPALCCIVFGAALIAFSRYR